MTGNLEAPYREITPAAMILGVVIGTVMAAGITYAGLLIGFTIPASTVAAILGVWVLRGVLKRGSIVENNINQTIASGINITCTGIIYTIPVLFLRKATFSIPAAALSGVVGALVGTLFIAPLRKQMIDLRRLPFPSGIATAAILKAPGAGRRKTRWLLGGVGLSFALAIVVGLPQLTHDRVKLLPEMVSLGGLLGLRAYWQAAFALSLLSVGAGFLSGRHGLAVLYGGVLANWIVSPVAVRLGWLPAGLAEDKVFPMLKASINRPLGIGMLAGGALVGVLLTVPMLRAAFAGLRAAARAGGDRTELPLSWVYAGAAGSVVLLTLAAFLAGDVGLARSLATGVVATLWMWVAGVIVSECAGLTDWSPVSGMTIIAVTLMLFLTGQSVVVAVILGVSICVAITQASDMVTDLKAGHLVGSVPYRQQLMHLVFAWIGPLVSLGTVFLLKSQIDTGKLEAPQAQALNAVVTGVTGGDMPWAKYAAGAAIGGLGTLAAGSGMGVLVGLSMYLPMGYVLTYGVGCVAAMLLDGRVERRTLADAGVPLAAGLIVGESLGGVVVAIVKMVNP